MIASRSKGVVSTMVRARDSIPELQIPLFCSYVSAGVESLPLAVVSAF